MKVIKRIKHRLDFIQKADTSLQIKFLLVRSIQWYHVYHVSCLPPLPVSDHIIDCFEKYYSDFVALLFNIDKEDPALHVRLFSPLEDGGAGLLPYSAIRDNLYNETKREAMKLLVDLGFEKEELEEVAPNANNNTLKGIWKHAMRTRASLSKVNLISTHPDFPSDILSSWPKNYLYTMSDDCFHFYFRYRMGLVTPPKNFLCPKIGPLSQFSPSQCFSHLNSCTNCGSFCFHLRHEKINNVIHKTFSKHSIAGVLNPKDLPLPEKQKGGPDFLLFVGSKTLVGDVSVTSFSMDSSWNRKKRTYNNLLEENPHLTLFPFIVSTKGTFHPKTISILQEIQRETISPYLLSEILSLTLFEMFKGIFIAYQLLITKGYLQKDQADQQHTTEKAADEAEKQTHLENAEKHNDQQQGEAQEQKGEKDEEIVHSETSNESERKKEEPSAKKTRKEKPD